MIDRRLEETTKSQYTVEVRDRHELRKSMYANYLKGEVSNMQQAISNTAKKLASKLKLPKWRA